MHFLTARELVSFARTQHRYHEAVAAEFSERSDLLDAQYTALFDERRSLNAQFAVLRQGKPTLEQLRAVRGRMKTLGTEMDDKLQAWGEIQHAWDGAGISQPRPVLSRDESYLDQAAPSATAIQSASLG